MKILNLDVAELLFIKNAIEAMWTEGIDIGLDYYRAINLALYYKYNQASVALEHVDYLQNLYELGVKLNFIIEEGNKVIYNYLK